MLHQTKIHSLTGCCVSNIISLRGCAGEAPQHGFASMENESDSNFVEFGLHVLQVVWAFFANGSDQ